MAASMVMGQDTSTIAATMAGGSTTTRMEQGITNLSGTTLADGAATTDGIATHATTCNPRSTGFGQTAQREGDKPGDYEEEIEAMNACRAKRNRREHYQIFVCDGIKATSIQNNGKVVQLCV
jgi:hypothetical protein